MQGRGGGRIGGDMLSVLHRVHESVCNVVDRVLYAIEGDTSGLPAELGQLAAAAL